MNRAAHFQIENVTHRYRRGQDCVLDNVSLTIEPGQSTALVGRSGCGKSTLLQIACGMMMPSTGKVYVDGTPIHGPSPEWNLMFQEPLLFPWMTVRQNAALGLRFSGRMKDAAHIIDPLLDMVGLTALADTNVQQLSGGQQQRAALARSLATEPTALFLDEPFSALDVVTRRELQRDVLAIARRLELTMVVVTHDLDEALSMGQRVVVMTPNPGRIAAVIDAESVDSGTQGDGGRRRMRQEILDIFGGEEADGSATIERLPDPAELARRSKGAPPTGQTENNTDRGVRHA